MVISLVKVKSQSVIDSKENIFHVLLSVRIKGGIHGINEKLELQKQGSTIIKDVFVSADGGSRGLKTCMLWLHGTGKVFIFSVLTTAHLLALRMWNFLLDAVKKAIVLKLKHKIKPLNT